MIYLELFVTFFQIGLFSVGGGYASIPLIESQVVNTNGWLTPMQFSDIMIIAEMTPGPVIINTATFVGLNMGGLLGAVICTLGAIAPSLIIVLMLYFIYKKYNQLAVVQGVIKGLKPAIIALITTAGISLLMNAMFSMSLTELVKSISNNLVSSLNFDVIGLIITIVSFIILRRFKISPIKLMVIMGTLGMLVYTLIPLIPI